MPWYSITFENNDDSWHFVTSVQGVPFLKGHMLKVHSAKPVIEKTIGLLHLRPNNISFAAEAVEMFSLFGNQYGITPSEATDMTKRMLDSNTIEEKWEAIATHKFTLLLSTSYYKAMGDKILEISEEFNDRPYFYGY